MQLCTNDLYFCNYIIINKKSIVYYIKENPYKLWELILASFKNENDANNFFEKPLLEWEFLPNSNFKFKLFIKTRIF